MLKFRDPVLRLFYDRRDLCGGCAGGGIQEIEREGSVGASEIVCSRCVVPLVLRVILVCGGWVLGH